MPVYEGITFPEYPMRTCREPIFDEFGAGHSCELPDLHRGPCVTLSSRATLQRHKAWMAANPEQVNTQGEDLIVAGERPGQESTE